MLSERRAVFTRGVHHAAIVGIKAQKTIVARTGLQRIAADGAVSFGRAWRVLNLVINALRELRSRAHRFTQRLELPRIGSALCRGIIREGGSHLTQRCDSPRFGLRRGIALALGHYEPQKTPDRSKKYAQQNAPAQQNVF